MKSRRGLWARFLRRGAGSDESDGGDPQYQRELEEFLAADTLPVQGDENFRERLREKLWRDYIEK